MSEPIRNKKADFPVAPYVFSLFLVPAYRHMERKKKKQLTQLPENFRTPQNTPANNAPISSHAQQPGVSSIKEGR
jgi:nucleosome assembly protein 1-like 1